MSTKLSNTTGSGSVLPNSIMSFSYTEDVTSLQPKDLKGGAGQVTVSAIAASKETMPDKLHPSSKLLINNTMRLEDDLFGNINFVAKSVSLQDSVVSVTGETLQARLNVEKTAAPQGGSGATLWTAIIYYCGLVDIVPTISTELQATLDAIPVNFIGWQGNVWEHLKMLCAAVSLSDTDNIGLEMFVNEDELVFREAKTTEIDFSEHIMSKSIQVTSVDTAQSQAITYYDTSYGVNQVIAERDRTGLTDATQNVTIDDQMQVEPGETVVKRFTVNASLESVKQPIVVSAISTLPYTGSTGEYVVVGSDDLPIQPSQWTAEGGSLTVSITENPNEIELVIVAPPATELPTAQNPARVTLGPYKIGTETADGEDYPALYIVGTGVFYEEKTKVFGTGASQDFTSEEDSANITNPFFVDKFDVSCRGVAAAQAACGPTIGLSITVADGVQFADSIGKIFYDGSNKYRISSVSFSSENASIQAEACANFTDFTNIWTGKTFNDFTARAGDQATYPDEAMKFNEFSVIPLMEA